MRVYKWLYLVAALLFVAFLVLLGVDYHTYVTVIGSAPYYAYVLIRVVELLLPGMAVFLVAFFLQRKHR